jgi:hypothetical protein
MVTDSPQQDSSLGSFEGDASRESLECVSAGAPEAGRSPRPCPARQRPLTSLDPARPSSPRDLYAVLDPRTKKKRPGSSVRTRSAEPASTVGGPELRPGKAGQPERDSRVDSGSVDLGTPSLGTPPGLSPKSPLEALDEALDAVMPMAVPGKQGQRAEFNPLVRAGGAGYAARGQGPDCPLVARPLTNYWPLA